RACAVPGSARSPTTWRSYDEPLRLAHAPYTLRRGNDNGGGGARVLRAAAWRHHLAGPRRDLPATGPRRAPDLPLADEGNRRGCGPCGPHHPWRWRWLTHPILRSSHSRGGRTRSTARSAASAGGTRSRIDGWTTGTASPRSRRASTSAAWTDTTRAAIRPTRSRAGRGGAGS